MHDLHLIHQPQILAVGLGPAPTLPLLCLPFLPPSPYLYLPPNCSLGNLKPAGALCFSVHRSFSTSSAPPLLSTSSPPPLLSSPLLLSLYLSDRQVTCDPPGEAALWVKHTEFGFSLCPSPTLPLYHSTTLPLYHSPTLPLTHSPTLPLYASDRQETVTRQGRRPSG